MMMVTLKNWTKKQIQKSIQLSTINKKNNNDLKNTTQKIFIQKKNICKTQNILRSNNIRISWNLIRLSVIGIICLFFPCTLSQSSETLSTFGVECPTQELILPCRCLTREDEYQIWCSHSELPHVAEGLASLGQLMTSPLDELILENNNFPSLPARFFQPLKVVRLMLRNNNLERVASDWLAGLEDILVELYIVEPTLRTLPADSLRRMSRLEAITIRAGMIKRAPAFAGLPRLRHVHLDTPRLEELATSGGLEALPTLEKVHIISATKLQRLHPATLRDLPNLNLVNFSQCGIEWLHPRAFTQLPSLTELYLVGNQISDPGMIGRGTRDLQALSILKLDNNIIGQIPEATFVDLPSLKEISISHNRITEIHHGAFYKVPMLKTVNLNHNLVRRVHPESFLQHSGSGIEEIWLINNDISHVSELRSLLDALPRLTFLDMSLNYLEEIPFGSLRGHAMLERLHLDHNKIHMIEREAFVAMPALRELRLKNNSLSNILEGPFWNLPALKGLDLSHNYFKRIEPRLLAMIPSLRKVDLSKNEIFLVDPATFLETPVLEHVNLSHNSLPSLHPATFRTLMNLYELDVSDNRLREFVPGLPRAIENLYMSKNLITSMPQPPSPDLDLPALRVLDISGNGLHRLMPGSMKTLPQLRKLNLGKNSLQQLEEGCFEGLSKLEVLDLKDNNIDLLHPKCLRDKRELRELNFKGNRLESLRPEVLQDVHQLRKLDLSNNFLGELMPGIFLNTRELRYLDISYNVLPMLPSSVRNLKNLEVLDITSNRLHTLGPESLGNLPSLSKLIVSKNRIEELREGAFNNLPELEELDLGENEIENIESNAIYGLPSLKIIKLHKNRLRFIANDVFSELPSLQIAEFQENQIQAIVDGAFHNVPHLLLLNLSYNMIPGIDDAGLRNLRSLEVLDLSHNRVQRVDSNSLAKMEWLVELKLDDNKICMIEGTPFDEMPRLKVLSLKNNRMTSIPEYTMKNLKNNIAVLDIDGNPIICTCSMMWMRGWLEDSSEMGPRCSDGSFLRESSISVEDCSSSISAEDHNSHESGQIHYREPLASGCEAEIIDSDIYGTAQVSQVFSPWQNIKSNASPQKPQKQKHTNPASMAPSPLESDYFYDEYIDYPYNETSVLGLEHNNSIVHLQKPNLTTQVTTTSTTTTEKISPHFIPGDTPTLYAEPKPKNQTSQQTPPQNMVQAGMVQNQSPFTFFGMPIPPLNLGTLWGAGSGRSADRRQSAGQAQRLPTPPKQSEIEKGGFVPMLPGSGGFKPIVNPELHLRNYNYSVTKESFNSSQDKQPSTIEFYPIQEKNETVQQNFHKRGPAITSNKNSGGRNLHFNPVPTASITKVERTSISKLKQANTKIERISPSSTPKTITHKPNNKNFTQTVKKSIEHTTKSINIDLESQLKNNNNVNNQYTENIKTTTERSIPKLSVKKNTLILTSTTSTTTDTPKYFINPFSDDKNDEISIEINSEQEQLDNINSNIDKFTNIAWETTTINLKEEITPSYTFEQFETPVNLSQNLQVHNLSEINHITNDSLLNDIWGGELSEGDTKPKTEASLLSITSMPALLVPDGLQTQFRPSGGRSTITKISSPYIKEQSDSSEQNNSDDIKNEEYLSQESSNHEGKTNFVQEEYSNIRVPSYDNSMSWYFKIYNESNLQPFVGPGADEISSVGTLVKYDDKIVICNFIIAFYLCKYILTYF